MRVVRLRDSHVGKTTLEHFEGDGRATLIPKYRDLLKRELQARRQLGRARKVGIITFQELIPDCIAALQEVGYTYSDDPKQTEIVTGYYYNLRGANDFKGCDALVLLGYPRPNPQGLYEEACAIYQDDPVPISQEPAPYSDRLRLRSGHSIPIDKPLFGYNDSRLQSMLIQKSRAELYQAFHRARPFAPETSVQEVLLFTDVPVPGVPVDTFFGRDGRMFDCLTDLLVNGDVTVPQLVDAFMAVCGPDGDGASKESLHKWVRGKNSAWLDEATGTEFVPGRGRGNPGVFRTRAISNI